MAKKVIYAGITANDATGDSLRAGAQAINSNFTELYNALGGETGAPLGLVSKVLAGKGIIVSSPTGEVLVTTKPATADEIGGIRIGTGLSIDEDGVVTANFSELPKASQTILGGIKVGARLSIDANGVLSADSGAYTLPKATSSVLGGIKIGSGLEIDAGGIVSVNQFDQTLNTTDVVGFAGIVSRVYTTEASSSVFQRNNNEVIDTGLNIRSTVDKKPIYIYNYGSNGDGRGGSEIDIKELSVDIYTKYDTDLEQKWQFTNATNNGNSLIAPTMILGSTGTQDQLISRIGTHSISLSNFDFESYIKITGPADPNTDNIGVQVPRANKISIIANNLGDFVDGLGYTSQGRIELIAGGEWSPYRASIKMGQLGDMSQAFPPTGTAVDTLTNTIEMSGTAFYGDVILQGSSTLGIRNKIIFQDGTEQTTAYPGAGGPLISIPPGEFTVIYTTGTNNRIRAIKLFVLIETIDAAYEVQTCEIIAAINDVNSIHLTVYGITYTGTAPIATFEGQYVIQPTEEPGVTTSEYRIRARPTSETTTLQARVSATVLNTTYLA